MLAGVEKQGKILLCDKMRRCNCPSLSTIRLKIVHHASSENALHPTLSPDYSPEFIIAALPLILSGSDLSY